MSNISLGGGGLGEERAPVLRLQLELIAAVVPTAQVCTTSSSAHLGETQDLRLKLTEPTSVCVRVFLFLSLGVCSCVCV